MTTTITATTTNSKRDDIQFLRAVAIFSVLGYHLLPENFPNGLYGVDMFFAISGFLMAKTMDNGQPMNWHNLSTFYVRRIKRIFVVYLFDLLLVLILGQLLLYRFYLEKLQEEIYWAELFATNLYNTYKKLAYGEMVSIHLKLLNLFKIK